MSNLTIIIIIVIAALTISILFTPDREHVVIGIYENGLKVETHSRVYYIPAEKVTGPE